jgi:hypothetical protein
MPSVKRGLNTYNPETQNALHLSHMFNAAKDYGACTFNAKLDA